LQDRSKLVYPLLAVKRYLETTFWTEKRDRYRRWLGDNRWDEKAGLQRDALSSQVIAALEARETRRPAMKKLTTTMMQQTLDKQDGRLTVGLDLGDRSSFYCVLDKVGEVLLEQKVSTTPKAIKEIFGAMPRSRIALETGLAPSRGRRSIRKGGGPSE
jgi:hypothetical protein